MRVSPTADVIMWGISGWRSGVEGTLLDLGLWIIHPLPR